MDRSRGDACSPKNLVASMRAFVRIMRSAAQTPFPPGQNAFRYTDFENSVIRMIFRSRNDQFSI